MSVHASAQIPATIAEVGELYSSLSTRLEQIVRLGVRAPDPVVEDACQFAWGRLLHHRDRVCRDSALSWLATTAVREAFKLLRRESRCLSLDATVETVGELPLAARSQGPEELVENRERLELVRLLPERQQKLLWLHAVGLSYAEIAIHTGDTVRTVERQLLRAKRGVREAAAKR
jgi:RNA polymerase sigma factor (sigma-70 family)